MEFKEDKPIYLQIVNLVCDDILAGRWKVPGKIPSVRDLALELTVNPHTILRSYEILEADKIIENKRGVGFFISKSGIGEILKIRKAQFYKEQLPEFFKTLDSLKIPVSEIELMYKTYKDQ